MRVQERRRLRNRAVRSATRTYVRKAQAEIASGESNPTAEVIRQAISALDRAAKKGVIHANNAARRKSRLMKKLNQQASQASA
jgi:small subunit ribosomal protein S20